MHEVLSICTYNSYKNKIPTKQILNIGIKNTQFLLNIK